MNVLVTGLTGFIGSRLAAKLVSEGHTVYGLVRHTSERELSRLKSVISQIRLVEGDLATYHSILSAVQASDPHIVFHLGALTPVRLSFDDPYPYVTTNFEGTVNLVHAIIKETPNTRLIIASTAEVYGWQPSDKPIREDSPLNPASPYAVTKVAADEYVQMASKVYHLKGTVLRPINTYGRTGESGFLVEYLVSKMLAGETCYIGTPDSVRDYMYVEDHVSAYLHVANSPEAVGKVYNVSPGNPVTNADVVKKLSNMTGFKGEIVLGSYPPGYPQRPKSQDPQYLALDNSRIVKDLGWKSKYTLEDGLSLTIKSWKSENVRL
jgi:nucleoside-diphosphate-sugar epimerase